MEDAMDRLEAMSIVLLTVEKGSLTGAAKALNMPLPTVSRKVTELEAYLGTRLMLRSTRKLTLTDAGMLYVQSARRILEDIDEVERVASGEYSVPRGELVLTAPSLFGTLHMLGIVTDFLAAYPEINVRLLLSNQNLDLLDERIDMAVRIGALPDSAMIATRVGEMRTVVCASPELLAAHGVPKKPQHLQSIPCVSFAGAAIPSWSFRDPVNKRLFDVPIVPRLSVTAGEAVVEAAVKRAGVARVLHYHCADALRQGRLVRILQQYELEPVPVHLLHAARGQLPLKMRVFLDFAAGKLRSDLAGIVNLGSNQEHEEPSDAADAPAPLDSAPILAT
jgi:DNA-binding transcriptional LysR family regulator